MSVQLSQVMMMKTVMKAFSMLSKWAFNLTGLPTYMQGQVYHNHVCSHFRSKQTSASKRAAFV
jgi:hypothetical protein